MNLGGPLTISAGDSTQTDKFFAATLTGDGNLAKTGSGRFILSGNSPSWTGDIALQEGTLRSTAANSLGGGGYFFAAASGTTFEIKGGITLNDQISLDGAKLLSLSGDNSITSSVGLQSSSTIEVQQDSITLNGAVSTATGGLAADLTLAGAGDVSLTMVDLVESGSFDVGSVLHTGSGTAFLGNLNTDRVESTGGGTVFIGSSTLPSGATIYLDNGSVLRRDKDETVTGATLELGSGGGGISVGGSYFWLGFSGDWVWIIHKVWRRNA